MTDIVETRKAIVRDAIAQIKAGKLIPQREYYIRNSFYEGACYACAVGSLLVSKLSGDTHAAEQIQNTFGMFGFIYESSLDSTFGAQNLRVLEAVFERKVYELELFPRQNDVLIHIFVSKTEMFHYYLMNAVSDFHDELKEKYPDTTEFLLHLLNMMLRHPEGLFQIPRRICRKYKVK